MHILKNRDISQRNFEKIPVTAAKKGTVINNLDPLDAWICSKAMEGGFRVTHAMGAPCFRCFGKDSVMTRELYAAYLAENKAAKGCSSLIGFMSAPEEEASIFGVLQRHHDRNGNGMTCRRSRKSWRTSERRLGLIYPRIWRFLG